MYFPYGLLYKPKKNEDYLLRYPHCFVHRISEMRDSRKLARSIDTEAFSEALSEMDGGGNSA